MFSSYHKPSEPFIKFFKVSWAGTQAEVGLFIHSRVNYFFLFESARQVRSVTFKYLHLRALAQLLDFIVFIVIFSNNSNYTKTHLTLGRDLAELFNCIWATPSVLLLNFPAVKVGFFWSVVIEKENMDRDISVKWKLYHYAIGIFEIAKTYRQLRTIV